MNEIKVGDSIIITGKTFWHTYPIGTICKVDKVFTKEDPFKWYQNGKDLKPDFNVKIHAVNDVIGGYELCEGEYEKVFAFDAEVEVNALKARIEALETALQRVPWADYNRNVVITEATVGRSNGLTYPIYGDSYTGDGILILSSVSVIAFCNEQPGRGDYIGISFRHKTCNVQQAVYKGTLFNVEDCHYIGEDIWGYEAESVGPISPDLMHEAKERINKI